MPDAPAALDEMLRVVRIGGLAIVRSPALASPVWPLIDLPSLLARGGPGRPPHYSNRREAARFFAANLARTARELFRREAGFEQRAPSLGEEEVGGDRDAACWTSALAIARRLRWRGARILQMAGEGPRFGPARLAGRLAPWLFPTVAVVARREAESPGKAGPLRWLGICSSPFAIAGAEARRGQSARQGRAALAKSPSPNRQSAIGALWNPSPRRGARLFWR